jgi:hypoxanthine phosphoribosyltransferase
MAELIPVITKDQIDRSVQRLAERISEDYQDGDLVLIGVLKGAFIFLADLARHLSIPVQIDFIAASSYGDGTQTSGSVKVSKKPGIDLINKDVLLVEDIIDTGLTVEYLSEYLESLGARSVKLCALIDKQERRAKEIRIDYACHVIKEGFLVGYGLDYADNYRQLKEVYNLKL